MVGHLDSDSELSRFESLPPSQLRKSAYAGFLCCEVDAHIQSSLAGFEGMSDN